MVDGVFTGNVAPCRLDQEQNKPDITHEHGTDQAAHLPIGLRNALTSSHRTARSSLDTRVKKFSHSFSASPRVTQAAEFAKPQAESFILNPWPVNTGVGPSANVSTAQEMNGALRVPLPCLSATDRWNKHTSKYTLSPKVSGDMICTHCDQKFTEVEEYTKHLDEKKVVHDNFCPDMSCAFAALGYRYRWLLRRHICNHHLKDYNNKKLRKNSSGKVTALTDNFLSHVYVCKKTNCLRAFYRLDSLLRHEKLIHSVCGKQKRKERLKLSKCDPKIFE
ncbi:hypothetical protein METBIDRAFT_212094 [Metschnikowia bicuspidata var. bicuspidata NRRL YB-4993]|uniref:C2H2-type domain-containing protein n=1 Tax=Metschnikowia bicuspidata var. bicuspidata NRRL YB-4993 TaxID=869754 RepID=A0A1A0H7U9_9ASCO|nr:hypothetical protein METBIDRAFT_212094 [Metschnikowia bicuspidata var. bicuspidata NRRL YB-4993]OBA20060.1 hypothetical protein METBIDRAFT_212094 [Metschnikowia bicuspidata var. bicuspidata NRRL YB-4993]